MRTVSVIMPIYNGGQYVEQAIESVLAQTYQDFELILINDGSTDDSDEVIRPFLRLPNIIYLVQKNRGVAAARNQGIRVSSGDYVALLDQDDVWLPEKLELQIDLMRIHNEIALTHGNIGYIDGEGSEFTPSIPYVTDASGHCFERLFMSNAIAVPTVLIRKKCLERVGPFDERIRYADDYDLWLRLAYYYPINHINRILALYRSHSNNASRNAVAHKIFTLRVLENILDLFPAIRTQIGPAQIDQRLHWLTRYISNLCFEANMPTKGLWYALKAKYMRYNSPSSGL